MRSELYMDEIWVLGNQVARENREVFTVVVCTVGRWDPSLFEEMASQSLQSMQTTCNNAGMQENRGN